MTAPSPRIDRLDVDTYRIPTDAPESDGTAEWDHTDLITVHAHAGDVTGFGWTYAAPATAQVIRGTLTKHVLHHPAFAVEGAWQAMTRSVRNAGRPGVCACAISAVDVALWDLKARLLNVPLIDLFGQVRPAAPLYGSGGFTSYDLTRLAEQLGGWVAQGISRVKMKIGRDAQADLTRVSTARAAIGHTAELFVDANGGYSRKQALAMSERFAGEWNVSWFEEPVSSDDLEGLHLLRNRMPARIDVAAGEYGYTPGYFERMLDAQAVDCLQADATRCGGYTGFLKAAALCEAHHLPLSAHCAPQLHAHVACCVQTLRHIEYFHDHVRIAGMLFEGALEPVNGTLAPDRARPGHGITLKRQAAERFRA
jgi:L-alanine-DL-glutamate epimerase-like enolase superfamily enzyme